MFKPHLFRRHAGVLFVALAASAVAIRAGEPPVIDPFGRTPSVREDALPGYVETSDGAIHPGHVYLTRDHRLKIYDEKLGRQREIPLRAVKQIDCRVKREWLEREWKFKQAASDEKIFTGRAYPVREHLHTITLSDNRTITGPLSGIVYVRPQAYPPDRSGTAAARPKVERFVLNKRSKGKVGEKLDSLVYVKLIKLGDEALAEGRRKAAQRRQAHERNTAAKPAGY